jgi:ketosteroid isomerase-like protein
MNRDLTVPESRRRLARGDESLHTSVIMDIQDLAVAREAMRTFRDGMASGAWKPFIAMLAPGFTMRVPVGELRGRVATREEAIHHFAALRLGGVRMRLSEAERTCVGESTVTFEVSVEGMLYGAPYINRLVFSLDIEDGKVTALREYFGELNRRMLAELPE